jgi:hypothetical protein
MRDPLERKTDFCGKNFWKSYLCSVQQREIGDYQNLPINPQYTYQLLLGDTNQGSISTTNRKPPVLMIARSMKNSTWKLRIPQEEESI